MRCLLTAFVIVGALFGLAESGILAATPQLTCSDCSNADGTTCTGATCKGSYCLYTGRTINGMSDVELSCTPDNTIMIPDGKTMVSANSGCVRVTVLGIEYAYEICNTGDYCDKKCLDPVKPADPTSKPAAPTVKCNDCSTDNGKTCTGMDCQGNYCLYAGRTINGMSDAELSCVPNESIMIPDGKTRVTANSGCVRVTVLGIEYAYEICNTGDYCDNKCSQPIKPADPINNKVTCKVSSISNGNIIATGIDCQGNYCLYAGTTSSTAIASTLSCYEFDSLTMPDGKKAMANSGCVKTTVDGVEYAYDICNTGDYCDTHCSGSSLSLLLSLLLLPLTLLLKSY